MGLIKKIIKYGGIFITTSYVAGGGCQKSCTPKKEELVKKLEVINKSLENKLFEEDGKRKFFNPIRTKQSYKHD